MKKPFKVILFFFTFVLLCLGGLLTYVKTALPNVGAAPELKVALTPLRIERGKYLAHHVAACMDCHSTRDWGKYTGPLIPGTLGKGGEIFDQTMGFPGRFVSKNITPNGIGDWSDGEIYRAITSGVDKSGKSLFPVMPYGSYGKMDKEDVYAIIAYLRTLEPIKNDVEEAQPDFPMNFIINTIPQKANPTALPDKKDTLAYGKYLFTVASCGECHTKQDKGAPIKGMEFAGGFEFPIPNGTIVRSSNITPDIESGIGRWSKQAFVNRFRAFADTNFVAHNIGQGDYNSIMPWTMYGKMTEEDLSAIYTYMRTLPPIKNKVIKFTKL